MLEEGRHYKKLSPFIAGHQKILDEFLDDFWDYYRDLLLEFRLSTNLLSLR
jgi:hypothetical protein